MAVSDAIVPHRRLHEREQAMHALVCLDAGRFVTHHFPMPDFELAYDTFARAADTGALKVVLSP
jgi:threonine dehydrogenase-like Zn-dependent dehydrogenase